ncbi:hypothetical protein [Microseira sp. BLCC-F43]|uniref:hypothetical protein n=1 Tax=Microseira sp. BLCC-F43 TaxID=3153602 RepID=UPI0035B8FE9D
MPLQIVAVAIVAGLGTAAKSFDRVQRLSMPCPYRWLMLYLTHLQSAVSCGMGILPVR